MNYLVKNHGEPDQQIDNVVWTKVAEIVLVVVVVSTAAVVVPGWQGDILIDSVLLFFLRRTIAVVVVVGLDPEYGDDLDEEEDASIDRGDDAQHLNKE